MTQVEIPTAGGTDEVPEDNVPIKYEVNGDDQRTTSGRCEGADLGPADQTLMGEVSVMQEISVSGVSVLRLRSPFFPLLLGPFWVLGFDALPPSSVPLLLLLLPLSYFFFLGWWPRAGFVCAHFRCPFMIGCHCQGLRF